MKQLKGNIRKIALLMIALFVLLTAYGAYSLLSYGNRWFSSSANTYVRQQKKNVTPGDILDVNGVLLADTNAETGARVYQADKTARSAVVHVLGDSQSNVSNGVESFMASYLYGFSMSFPERLSAFFSGSQRTGDTVQLTIDSALCTYIARELAADASLPKNLSGAVVVMNYKTGAVLCEMSLPLFDPYEADQVKDDPGKPFYNRAVQGLYAPGSTFKIITAAAALQSASVKGRSFQCTGLFSPDAQTEHVITDAGTDMDKNKIVSHGQLTLREAFKKSCNNTFAQIALELGDATLKKQAEAFGFCDNFLFRDLVVENSSYPTTNRTKWAVAWSGAGQSGPLASPLHMCLVACAVANNGVMMEPRLLSNVTAANGTTRLSFTSRVYRTALRDQEVVSALRDYMYAVVNETGGTGRAASLTGHTVYGKTGSAEVEGQENTNAWFVGFLGDADAPYAVSIVLENAGGGGEHAAPLAQKIFQYILANNH